MRKKILLGSGKKRWLKIQKTTQLKIELNPKELVLMSNLYLSKDFPHNFLTLEEVSKLLQISKATAISLTKKLQQKGCLTKVRGYMTFYYPINDLEIRRSVLAKLGLFG